MRSLMLVFMILTAAASTQAAIDAANIGDTVILLMAMIR
jgi:hypothetical protein